MSESAPDSETVGALAEPAALLDETTLTERLQVERDAIEVRLLEQEHRPLRAVLNFLEHWRLGPEAPRWRATAGAAVRTLLFRGGLTVTVTLGGLLGACLLWDQNRLIEDQNRYFQEQTTELREQGSSQFLLAQERRLTDLLKTLFERQECGASVPELCPLKATLRERESALLEAMAIQRALKKPSFFRLRGIDLEGAQLDFPDLSDVDLTNANLANTTIEGGSLQRSILRDANLSGSEFYGVDFSGAWFERTTVDGSKFQKCNLTSILPMSSSFRDTLFLESDLTASSFFLVDFEGGTFQASNLLLVEFSICNLVDADLESSRGLTFEAIDESRGGPGTVLPPEISQPRDWLSNKGSVSFESWWKRALLTPASP